MQTAADVGLSWGVHGLLRFADACSRRGATDAMEVIKAPVAPRYSSGEAGASSADAGRAEDAAAAAQRLRAALDEQGVDAEVVAGGREEEVGPVGG